MYIQEKIYIFTQRSRKASEGELHEVNDRVSELSTQNSTLSSHKRKLETDVAAMQLYDLLIKFIK